MRVEEKSRVVNIYMPLHHAQMCMFGRLPLGLLGVNIFTMWRGYIMKGAVEWRRKRGASMVVWVEW